MNIPTATVNFLSNDILHIIDKVPKLIDYVIITIDRGRSGQETKKKYYDLILFR